MLHNLALTRKNPELYPHPKRKTPLPPQPHQEIIELRLHIPELEAWLDHQLLEELLSEEHHQ